MSLRAQKTIAEHCWNGSARTLLCCVQLVNYGRGLCLCSCCYYGKQREEGGQRTTESTTNNATEGESTRSNNNGNHANEPKSETTAIEPL